jgi:hypothetical protein
MHRDPHHAQAVGGGHEREEAEGAARVREVLDHLWSVAREPDDVQDDEDDERDDADRQEGARLRQAPGRQKGGRPVPLIRKRPQGSMSETRPSAVPCGVLRETVEPERTPSASAALAAIRPSQ